jgi:hypothetical protein
LDVLQVLKKVHTFLLSTVDRKIEQRLSSVVADMKYIYMRDCAHPREHALQMFRVVSHNCPEKLQLVGPALRVTTSTTSADEHKDH